ncbi:MAG: hypothetical protein HC806_00585 [Anaerolineae bacterium]|nr:hypothetical protein [Anaerolineae bacterium]
MNGLRSIIHESDLPWHQRGGTQLRVIVGLAMVGGIATLTAIIMLLVLIVQLIK